MNLVLHVHSTVDIITNSSTIIYTSCRQNMEGQIFELINTILRIAGSTSKAEDLFEVKAIKSYDGLVDRVIYETEEDGEDDYSKIYRDLGLDAIESYSRKRDILEEYFKVLPLKNREFFDSLVKDLSDEDAPLDYMIIPKIADEKTISLLDIVGKFTYSEEGSC